MMELADFSLEKQLLNNKRPNITELAPRARIGRLILLGPLRDSGLYRDSDVN